MAGAKRLIDKALSDPLQARLSQPQRCQAEQTWWQVAADGVTLKANKGLICCGMTMAGLG